MQVVPPPTNATKRKAANDRDSDADDGDEQPSDVEMLDVSFEFFDPQPPDYHSLKLLLSQLLSHDAPHLDLGAIADLVLAQKLVGSTVKTDGATSDPYAVLTVLNLNELKDNPAISALTAYLLARLTTSPAFHSTLQALLSNPTSGSTPSAPKHVGLVLSERLVNMPPQIVPPMYKMLAEELQWARDDKEPYHFSHLLFLSRVFLSTPEELDEDPNATLTPTVDAASDPASKKSKKNKKKKKSSAASGAEKNGEEKTWLYHPEDEFIARLAEFTQIFSYTSAPAKNDGGDSFGTQTRGQLMLLPWARFDEVVEGLEGFLGSME